MQKIRLVHASNVSMEPPPWPHNIALVTFTFPDTLDESARAKSVRRFLRAEGWRFPYGVLVRERHKSGKVHYHMAGPVPWGFRYGDLPLLSTAYFGSPNALDVRMRGSEAYQYAFKYAWKDGGTVWAHGWSLWITASRWSGNRDLYTNIYRLKTLGDAIQVREGVFSYFRRVPTWCWDVTQNFQG